MSELWPLPMTLDPAVYVFHCHVCHQNLTVKKEDKPYEAWLKFMADHGHSCGNEADEPVMVGGEVNGK
jgi:hypothetical protein